MEPCAYKKLEQSHLKKKKKNTLQPKKQTLRALAQDHQNIFTSE